MTRTELFDKILKHLYDNPDTFWSIRTWTEQEFQFDDDILLETIVDELINKKLARPMNHTKWSLMLDYEGRLFIEKYGSYSAFKSQEEKTQTKETGKAKRSRLLDHSGKILAIIFGISALILGWLTYSDKQEINQLKKIARRKDSTDYANHKFILSQNKIIDSLSTFVTVSKMTPEKVIGKFIYTTVFGETALVINKNGDFSITSYQEFSWPMYEGNWKVSGDTLILQNTTHSEYPARDKKPTDKIDKFILINNELIQLDNNNGKYYFTLRQMGWYVKKE